MPIEREDSTIIYVGQLLWSKGVHILINAFIEVVKTIKNAKLIIIGSGQKNYEKYIKKIAKSNENIIFLGKIPHDELVTYYNRARVLVCPSITQEGIPLVTLEAMICGLPVITSDTAGISDVVKNGKTGLIFPSGNLQILCDSLHILLKDEDLWNTFSKNCESVVKEKYDWNSIVKVIENEYWKIIENQSN